MTCATHPDAAGVAFCRNCGKALCQSCTREWRGTIYCSDCLAAAQQKAADAGPAVRPLTTPGQTPSGPIPGLAFVLGLIPGVGAIYNGQYGKGIIHVVVLGLLISIVDSGSVGSLEPMFGILIAVWIFYMAFEAYHTAKKRLAGEPVDEFSGLLPASGKREGSVAGAVILILLGVAFLLNTLGYLRIDSMIRFWPVLLIAAGAYLLYTRLAGNAGRTGSPRP